MSDATLLAGELAGIATTAWSGSPPPWLNSGRW